MWLAPFSLHPVTAVVNRQTHSTRLATFTERERGLREDEEDGEKYVRSRTHTQRQKSGGKQD